MDTGTMTFQEMIFNARYGIIGAVLFVVFFGAFAREAVREVLAAVAAKRQYAHRESLSTSMFDPMLGATMADGGEPVKDKQQS